ncbi:hypothetical protein ACLOJK_005311 [Asimina triloba]
MIVVQRTPPAMSDRPIRAIQIDGDDEVTQIPPFTIITGHIFTARSVAIVPNVATTQTHRQRCLRWLIRAVQQTAAYLHHLQPATAVTTAARSSSSPPAIAGVLNPPWRTVGNPSGNMRSTMSPSNPAMATAEEIPKIGIISVLISDRNSPKTVANPPLQRHQQHHPDRRAAMTATTFVSIKSDGPATMAAIDSISTAFDFQIRRPRRRVRLLHQRRQRDIEHPATPPSSPSAASWPNSSPAATHDAPTGELGQPDAAEQMTNLLSKKILQGDEHRPWQLHRQFNFGAEQSIEKINYRCRTSSIKGGHCWQNRRRESWIRHCTKGGRKIDKQRERRPQQKFRKETEARRWVAAGSDGPLRSISGQIGQAGRTLSRRARRAYCYPDDPLLEGIQEGLLAVDLEIEEDGSLAVVAGCHRWGVSEDAGSPAVFVLAVDDAAAVEDDDLAAAVITATGRR